MTSPPPCTPGQAALIEAMRLEQARIYSATVPEYKNTRRVRDESLDPARPLDSYYGAASPFEIAQLTREVSDRKRINRSMRTRIETARAQGLTADEIATEVDIAAVSVLRVFSDQDAAATA